MSTPYPSLDAYAFIGDGHTSALVSTSGCIDWCCMPRMDSPACFGRLLDWEHGGHLTFAPSGDDWSVRRRYLPDTLVLETTFETGDGIVRMYDCVAMRVGGRLHPYRQLLRVVEGVEGSVPMLLHVEPRLEFGAVRPRVRPFGKAVTAVGGSTGLVFSGDLDLQPADGYLTAEVTVEAGERHRLAMQWHPPHVLDAAPPEVSDAEVIDARLSETIEWWRSWSERLEGGDEMEPARHSARVLKAMINPPTGAMVAAPTTSLPEWIGGERNWDYRYSWVRDSVFAVRSLTRLGADEEANGFRRFVERSAAGDADEVQVVYGVDGAIRLPEFTLELEGYRGSRPVRVGNDAYRQTQLDTYGYLLELEWEWLQRGEEPEAHYKAFMADTADLICRRWEEPDRGIWEVRGEPRHYVHSKVMCWVGLDRAVRMADQGVLAGKVERWRENRDELRSRIESEGVRDGGFVQAFGFDDIDAALLVLPLVGFVTPDDPRMVETTRRIRDELSLDGSRLIRRYAFDDGLEGQEGAFLPCCFWLAEVLAAQGETEEAKAVLAEATANGGELGLLSEEHDPAAGVMLGNYPQALTHLAHIDALCAVTGAGRSFPHEYP